MSSQGSPVPFLKFQMAPRLGLLTSSGSKKKEPKCTSLSEARASHSHKTWIEVCSSTPHHLHKGLQRSPIKCRCRLMVLCPVRRSITTLDCVLLRDRSLVLAVELGPEIIFWVCLCVLIYLFPFFLPGDPKSSVTWSKAHRGLTAVKHHCTKFSHHGDQAPRVCASLVYRVWQILFITSVSLFMLHKHVNSAASWIIVCHAHFVW
jgi:hypothetical protein